MLHQLYQYDDAIIRWSWRQVRGGRGGAGITADDDDTGTTLAVSNIGLVKWWLRLMSFECSSLIREREPLRYWLSVARRWEFHRIWECNLSAWLRCFVVKAPAVSISPALSLGGPLKRHCRSLITMILVELQTAKSSSSSNEWMSESCWWWWWGWVRALNGDDWLIKCQLDQTNRSRVIDWLSERVSLLREAVWLHEWGLYSLSLTLTDTEAHTHTVMQVPKWRCSNQISESVNERAIGRLCCK